MNTTISGCQALHGCEKKDQCLRYQNFQDHPLIGFHAYQSCKLSEFTENTYPHFIGRKRVVVTGNVLINTKLRHFLPACTGLVVKRKRYAVDGLTEGRILKATAFTTTQENPHDSRNYERMVFKNGAK